MEGLTAAVCGLHHKAVSAIALTTFEPLIYHAHIPHTTSLSPLFYPSSFPPVLIIPNPQFSLSALCPLFTPFFLSPLHSPHLFSLPRSTIHPATYICKWHLFYMGYL